MEDPLLSIEHVNVSELSSMDNKSDVVTPCLVPKYNTIIPVVASYVAFVGVICDPLTTLTAPSEALTNVWA